MGDSGKNPVFRKKAGFCVSGVRDVASGQKFFAQGKKGGARDDQSND